MHYNSVVCVAINKVRLAADQRWARGRRGLWDSYRDLRKRVGRGGGSGEGCDATLRLGQAALRPGGPRRACSPAACS